MLNFRKILVNLSAILILNLILNKSYIISANEIQTNQSENKSELENENESDDEYSHEVVLLNNKNEFTVDFVYLNKCSSLNQVKLQIWPRFFIMLKDIDNLTGGSILEDAEQIFYVLYDETGQKNIYLSKKQKIQNFYIFSINLDIDLFNKLKYMEILDVNGEKIGSYNLKNLHK